MKAKAIVLGTIAVVGSAVAAIAGGLAAPIATVAPIVEEQSSSSAGWIIPLVLIGLIAVALSTRDSAAS